MEKLSTVEGLKNRHEIIESLSVDELKTNMSLKEIKDMSKQEVIKMDEIIKSTLSLDPEKLTKKLSTEFPNYNFDANSYRDLFMKATEEEINSGKTVAERDRFRKEILDADLLEIQSTGGTSNITDIKNVIRENYTHNSMLNEIKNIKPREYVDELKILEVEKEIYSNQSKLNKVSLKDTLSLNKFNASDVDLVEGKAKITKPFGYIVTESEQIERGIDHKNVNTFPVIATDSGNPLKEILNKGKNIQSLEDLKDDDKEKFESESLKLQPDNLINTLKNRSDYAEDSYIDSVIIDNIDNSIKELQISNPKLNKQQLIETLIQNNPENKDKILSVVSKTLDEQLEIWKNKYSEKEFKAIKKYLAKEDLNELESLSENRTEDQIKTLASINRSHNKFLHEIKSKASQRSLRKEEFNDTSIDNTSSSIGQIDETMNLFD